MLAFVIRRLAWAILLVVIITFITFLVFFIIPGEKRGAPGQHGLVEQTLQAQFNLHGTVVTQYAGFLRHVIVHGDVGVSRLTGQPAMDMIKQGLPLTTSLLLRVTLFF